MPHPATMFFLLTLGVIFLSWIFDVYGLSVRLPSGLNKLCTRISSPV